MGPKRRLNAFTGTGGISMRRLRWAVFSRAIPVVMLACRTGSQRTLLALTTACAVVMLAGAGGASALAANSAAAAPLAGQPAPVHPAAAYYSIDGDLLGVGTASADNAWAVGYAYTAAGNKTLMLHWNGRSWSRVTSPAAV
jgi:hypothetical protein